MAATNAAPRLTSSSRLDDAAHHLDQRHQRDRIEEVQADEAPGIGQPGGDVLDLSEEVLVASTAPGFSLPSTSPSTFCLISRFSTIASMTTSARSMRVAVGIGDETRLGRVALRLGLELARKQLALRGDALVDLLGRDVLQRHLHAARDAPAGDVGTHGAGADDVHALGRQPSFLGAWPLSSSDSQNTRRRLRD